MAMSVNSLNDQTDSESGCCPAKAGVARGQAPTSDQARLYRSVPSSDQDVHWIRIGASRWPSPSARDNAASMSRRGSRPCMYQSTQKSVGRAGRAAGVRARNARGAAEAFRASGAPPTLPGTPKRRESQPRRHRQTTLAGAAERARKEIEAEHHGQGRWPECWASNVG